MRTRIMIAIGSFVIGSLIGFGISYSKEQQGKAPQQEPVCKHAWGKWGKPFAGVWEPGQERFCETCGKVQYGKAEK